MSSESRGQVLPRASSRTPVDRSKAGAYRPRQVARPAHERAELLDPLHQRARDGSGGLGPGLLDIPLFASALTDADLRAAGVDDLEVQRMPAGSNPSWVSKQQWDRIETLLHERPG